MIEAADKPPAPLLGMCDVPMCATCKKIAPAKTPHGMMTVCMRLRTMPVPVMPWNLCNDTVNGYERNDAVRELPHVVLLGPQ